MVEYSIKGNSLAFADVDVKEGIVSGYFASFDNEPDSDGDIILPGSFAKTIRENGPQGKGRIKHLQDHNWSKCVCVIQELGEDQKGLRYVSKIGRHSDGKDFLLMVEDGIIKEHSFGYRIVKQHKNDQGWNVLTDLRMFEGSSLQGWGANGNTPITGLKSMEDILDHYDRLYKALKHGSYSDEVMIKFQEQHTLISEFIKTTQPNVITNETTVPSEKEESQKILTTFKHALGEWKQNC